MSTIVSNCQHCDEQQFQTLPRVHYAIFLVAKLDYSCDHCFMDRILAQEKKLVRLAYILLLLKSLSDDQNRNFKKSN